MFTKTKRKRNDQSFHTNLKKCTHKVKARLYKNHESKFDLGLRKILKMARRSCTYKDRIIFLVKSTIEALSLKKNNQ